MTVISIVAKDRPLSEILDKIEEKSGLEIFIPDFEDRIVSANIEQLPVHDALTELIGPDIRYHLNILDDRLSLGGRTEDKKGRKVEAKDLPKKPDTSWVDDSQIRLPRQNVKQDTDQVKIIVSDGSGNSKTNPSRTANVSGEPKKKGGELIDTITGGFTQLQFSISNEKIKLIEVIEVPGQYIHISPMQDDYIYFLKIGSKISIVGSFRDPTVQHTYFPKTEEGHEVLKAKIGYFTLTIQYKYRTKSQLDETLIEFFKLVEPLDVKQLTPATLEKYEKRLKPVQVIRLSDYTELFKF